MKATHEGKQYEVMKIDDALDEFNKHKAMGVHKAIMEVDGGYIVVDPLPPRGGGETDA